MTTQPDPTIRERLRELAERDRQDWAVIESAGLADNPPPHTLAMADRHALLLVLDTLERRVRAAERALADVLDVVDDVLPLAIVIPNPGQRRLLRRTADEARSLITEGAGSSSRY